MIDLSKQHWDMKKATHKIISLLDADGYDIVLKKQYQSKDVFIVSKDDISTEIEISSDTQASMAKAIVENFKKRFSDLITVKKLKEELKLKENEALRNKSDEMTFVEK